MSREEATVRSSGWSGRHGPLLIAEIGGNHEGDVAYARRLVELAAASGADMVKFQVYYAKDFVNPRESPDRYAHFEKFELSPEDHIGLAELCTSLGVRYLASVWSLSAMEWLDDHLSMYKIGSGDLTAHRILEFFAARGKPIILSTGLSTLAEVTAAVDVIRSVDASYRKPERLSVLQCTSSYPLPKEDANLRAMETLRRATGAAVGYSNHTTDRQALLLAAGLGAEVLEFHFTDTKDGKVFRDHFVSLTPEDLESFIKEMGEQAILLGDGEKRPLPSEVAAGHVESFRRAVFFDRALPAGAVVTADDLALLRPMVGLEASRIGEVVGRKLSQPVERHDRVDLALLDG